MARFKIPINEYYQKSREIKDKTEQTVQEFENKFVNFISSNSSGVDNQDLDKLMSSSAYDKAKKNLNKLETEDLINLEKMAQEGSNNPIDKLLELDQKYADEFQKIAQGNFGDELSRKINAIETKVQALQGKHEIKAFISQLKGMVDSETFNTLMKLADELDYLSLVDKLLSSKAVGKALNSMPRFGNMIYKILEYILDGTDKIDAIYLQKLDKVLSSDKLIKLMDKASPVVIDKFLSAAVKLEKIAPSQFGKIMKNFLTKCKNIVNPETLRFLEPVLKSNVGKVVTNPYLGVTVSGIYNTYEEIKKTGHLVKGVVNGAIDTVTNIRFTDGVVLGAETGSVVGTIVPGIGNFMGAVGGMFIGSVVYGVIKISKMKYPKWPEKLKKMSNRAIDKLEKGAKDITKTVSSKINRVAHTMQDEYNDAVKNINKHIKNLEMPRVRKRWF